MIQTSREVTLTRIGLTDLSKTYPLQLPCVEYKSTSKYFTNFLKTSHAYIVAIVLAKQIFIDQITVWLFGSTMAIVLFLRLWEWFCPYHVVIYYNILFYKEQGQCCKVYIYYNYIYNKHPVLIHTKILFTSLVKLLRKPYHATNK